MAERIVPILGLLIVCAAGPAQAQGRRDAEELRPLVVLEVDTAANQIRARESDSTRIRTIELGERSAIFSDRGTLALSALQTGDRILVPGVVGSTSDRVRADQIQLLAADPVAPAGSGEAERAPERGREPAPSALRRDGGGVDVLQPDPTSQPGRVGVFPSASDQPPPGTGSRDDPGAGEASGNDAGGGGEGTGSTGPGGAGGGGP